MHGRLKIKASISSVCFNFAMISASSSPLLLLLKIIFLTGRSVFNYDVHGVQQWACAPLALLLLFANLSNFTLVKFSCKSPFKREASRERYVVSNLQGDLSLRGLRFVMGCVSGFEGEAGCWLGPEINCLIQKLWTGILILFNYYFTDLF